MTILVGCVIEYICGGVKNTKILCEDEIGRRHNLIARKTKSHSNLKSSSINNHS